LRVLGAVQQDDLYSNEACGDNLAVLTAPEAVYIWKGKHADVKQFHIVVQVRLFVYTSISIHIYRHICILLCISIYHRYSYLPC
jgi:hypothetical protein